MISKDLARTEKAICESRLHVEDGVAEAAGVRLATCEGTGPNPWSCSGHGQGEQ